MEETEFYSLTAFENERLPCIIFGIILFARYICQTNLNIRTKLPTRPNKSVDLENTIVSDWLIAPFPQWVVVLLFMSLHYYLCYKLVQRFRVTCLFTGQYTTKAYGTITDVIYY